MRSAVTCRRREAARSYPQPDRLPISCSQRRYNFAARAGSSFFQERIGGSSIQVIEGETSDALAHADVAIAASGTVTVEAAILGTPMVTFYKVTALELGSWADFWFGFRSIRW